MQLMKRNVESCQIYYEWKSKLHSSMRTMILFDFKILSLYTKYVILKILYIKKLYISVSVIIRQIMNKAYL